MKARRKATPKKQENKKRRRMRRFSIKGLIGVQALQAFLIGFNSA
jgi:hypothetical protein